MNKFRNRKSSFSTSSKKSTDNNFYYERNKHITDNSDKIDAVSTSPVDKSLTTEKLQEQLNNNMEQINKNMSSTKDILAEAKKVANSQTTHYGKHKSELDESQQNTVGNNLGINSTAYDKGPAVTSEVDKAFSNIVRGQKLLTDSRYKISSLQESLPEDQFTITRENYLNKGEETLKKFNTLSYNIGNLSSKNQDIRKELDSRHNSSYFPQDSSDVEQTEFSSFEPFDD